MKHLKLFERFNLSKVNTFSKQKRSKETWNHISETKHNIFTKESSKILVVDDDTDILEMLEYNLKKEGYIVKTAINGKKALEIVNEFRPGIILLDITMPVMDGFEVCKKIRENPKFKDTHIIFLTANSDEDIEVEAFDIGASDFITKPIRPRALISRLESVVNIRKKSGKDLDRLIFKDLIIDRTSHRVTYKGKPVTLTKKEFDLLNFLAENPNRVYNREELLDNIWGDVYVLDRTVDVHIRRVREKIGNGYISTIKGVGYKFEVDE